MSASINGADTKALWAHVETLALGSQRKEEVEIPKGAKEYLEQLDEDIATGRERGFIARELDDRAQIEKDYYETLLRRL